MGPGDLQEVLSKIPLQYDSRVIAGLEKPDDAGVYKITEELAIAQTVDLITAIVNDPLSFGRIAAANALSDIYAMGARPVIAMDIACFPTEKMDRSVLAQVLAGAIENLDKAGAVLVGGHTVRNDELKFGLAVTGVVSPDRVILKSAAKAGDSLVLTKPLGIGILASALKVDMLNEEQMERLIGQMEQLNKDASEAMVATGVNACTDVTGFGLAGHAIEMATSSGVGIEIFSKNIPVLSGVAEFDAMGLISEGLYANREFYESRVEGLEGLPLWLADLLFDPQTSGGLLISLPTEKMEELMSRLKERGVEAAVIGRVTGGIPGQVVIR